MELASVYERLEQLLEFRKGTVPSFRFHSKLDALLEGGITTAARIMSGILEVIPRVYGSPDDPDKLTQIARGSYPLVSFLSAQHGEVFIPTIVALKHPPVPLTKSFNPEFFAIEGEGDKKRLTLSQAGKQQLEMRLHKSLKESVSTRHESTVGCPALFNLGEGSGIKKLWDWHVEIAAKVYPLLVRGR